VLSPFDQVERQAILMDRIGRYRRRHKIASLGDAVERLIRMGLFVDAMPDGSRLVRREPEPEPGGPDDDILF